MSFMELGHYVALSVFVSYFLLIIALFYLVMVSVVNQAAKSASTKKLSKTTLTFGALSCVSFIHTWYHMIKFLNWSFRAYEASLPEPESVATGPSPLLFRIGSWLLDTSLFEQAWAAVSFGSLNWWWSQQLCLYTVGAWTVYLAIRGRDHRVRYLWAYMLLGQLVAISVASNLFFMSIHLSLSHQKTPSNKAHESNPKPHPVFSPTLYIPILLSLATIAQTPYTSISQGTFLPNLLLMHTLILIPLLCPSSSWLPIRRDTFIFSLFAVSLLLHARATLVAFSGLDLDVSKIGDWGRFVVAAWEVLNTYHPAQSSIGWDIVWTMVSFLVWGVLGDGEGWSYKWYTWLVLLSTPLVSVGAVAPFVLRFSGVEREVKLD